MAKSERKAIEGWIDKAGYQLQAAQDHLKSYYRYSEAIEAAQECVELSVKSILSLLGVEYKLKHKWDRDEFGDIAKQIKQGELLDRLAEENLYYCSRLPRLLLLANLWWNTRGNVTEQHRNSGVLAKISWLPSHANK